MRKSVAVTGICVVLSAMGVIAALGQDGAATDRGQIATGTRIAPGGTTRVFVMAGFDRECRPVGLPTVTIDNQPAKGSVTLKQGEQTLVQYSLSGRCVGTPVTGVGIYYTAKSDGDGVDAFSVTARLPGGETASRQFRMRIAE